MIFGLFGLQLLIDVSVAFCDLEGYSSLHNVVSLARNARIFEDCELNFSLLDFQLN
jgi:hypothetical protein